MKCSFQAGDAVVCVSELTDDEKRAARHPGPILDGIYHVRAVEIGLTWLGGIEAAGIKLMEIALPYLDVGECFFHSVMFRKLLTIDDFKKTETWDERDPNVRVPEHAEA